MLVPARTSHSHTDRQYVQSLLILFFFTDYALHPEVKSAQTGSHSEEDTSKSLIG